MSFRCISSKSNFCGSNQQLLKISSKLPRQSSYQSCFSSQIVANASDDFSASLGFLFPGQGAQAVGMAKDVVNEIPAAKDLFLKAADILGYDLLQVCVEGPKEKLDSTAVSQPAIYVASLAAVEQLRATEGDDLINKCDVTCGLSLGEYTALTFAGALSFEDGLKLVKLRGESMQAAADMEPSGMVSIIGLPEEKVDEICKAVCEKVGDPDAVKIANYLCPGNYAVSGSIAGCEKVEEIAKPEYKARMTVRLAVAGAFHTKYMQPAVEKLKNALENTPIQKPRIPVVSNVDGMVHWEADDIRDVLGRQVVSPVMWESSLKKLLDKGMTSSYELGPGKVIAGIMKRIDKTHPVTNVQV
eukprot:TRINITY_DN4855_c0_g1_i4.p2 TRINITY_DN4855_c0_g1~~TRINITY_DN4855_c0_g1_i4.p2  ORF type:complete len:357 (-),score=71.74 TRINITY_DN4855_c0_g1_i4:265-1335(-)